MGSQEAALPHRDWGRGSHAEFRVPVAKWRPPDSRGREAFGRSCGCQMPALPRQKVSPTRVRRSSRETRGLSTTSAGQQSSALWPRLLQKALPDRP